MDNEVTYYKTWYKCPYIMPDKDGTYDVCWHWNKGINQNERFICQIEWDTEEQTWYGASEYDEAEEDFETLDLSNEDKMEQFKRVVEAWSEITYPKFNED